jgi:hemerythrin-like domain-containing protein
MATTTDPIALITSDHRKVEQLFKEIESAEGDDRNPLVEELVTQLLVHMEIEEQRVYPLVQRDVDTEMAEEAEVEHDLARQGLTQLQELAPDSPGFGAALDMVRAGIKHHVEEEETELLPKLQQQMDVAELQRLGDELATMKAELIGSGAAELRSGGQRSGSGNRSRSNRGRSNGGGRSNGASRSNGGGGRGRSGDDEPTKAELVDQARAKGVSGFSRMTKDELQKALAKA